MINIRLLCLWHYEVTTYHCC